MNTVYPSRQLAGACVICFQPTDTALGARGVPAWHAAFLTTLGVPKDEALATFIKTVADLGAEFNNDQSYEIIYRVCAECVARTHTNFPSPVVTIPGAAIPAVAQPEEEVDSW